MLPGPLQRPLRAWQALPPWSRAAGLLARIATAGMVDHVTLRTAAIDACVTRAVAHGVRQLVVLGAGYDGRAWRLPGLEHVDVFEVDHPATAARKRECAIELPLRARSMHYATVDFGHQSVADRLADAGHDATVPSLWLWEGVTPYLPPPAITSTLADIAQRSAPGSRLAMTYASKPVTGLVAPRLDAWVLRSFAALGEPLLGLMSSATAAQRVRHHGFEPVEDSGQIAWARQAPTHARIARPFRAERLLEAHRPGDSQPV